MPKRRQDGGVGRFNRVMEAPGVTPALSETWKAVVGFEGLYEVSDAGRVRSLPRKVLSVNRWGPTTVSLPGKMLTLLTSYHGYYKVLLSKQGKATNKLVGTLVAEAFIGKRPPGLLVLHSDGNAKNNAVSNLRYGTQQDNMQDSIKHGTRPNGAGHYASKLTVEAVKHIRSSDKSNAELARLYVVATSAVRLARIGKTWKQV